MNKKDWLNYCYGNTDKEMVARTGKIIKENRNKKLWSIALYFDIKRLAKYQRAKDLFWEGANNEFDLCRTSDMKKYNGLYTFDEAFKLFKEINLTEAELVRLNFNMPNFNWAMDHYILVRDFGE